MLASGFAKRVDEKVATLHFPAFDAELIVLTCVRQIIQVSNSSVLPIAVSRLQGRLENLGCATQRYSWPDSGYMTSVFGGMWNSAVFLREGGPRILHVPLVSGSLHVRRVARFIIGYLEMRVLLSSGTTWTGHGWWHSSQVTTVHWHVFRSPEEYRNLD